MAEPDRESILAAAARIGAGGAVTTSDVQLLARSLLEIAELAMPDTYFASDSRCRLARAVLEASDG